MDEFTPNLNLPLPVRENQLRDDVGRLRDAFGIIDAAVSTKADLVDGKVPSSQLPSYVDDVLEYANFAGFPATGEAGKIYVAIDTSKVYRWGGSAYAVISDFVFLPATPTTLGGVKVGSGLGIDPDGVLYVVGGGGGSGLPVYGDQSIAPASNGQTVFTVTGGYNPGQLDVWLNGVMLVGNGDDYTASNGTTFALTVGASTTDLLLVRKWIYLPEAQAVAKTGDTMTGALNWAAATTVASATTTNIGLATSNNVTITGTTAITSFGSYAAGAVRTVTFAGALTLTHNALSLILPGGINITTAAGDVAVFVSLGSGNWRCTGYQKANGQSVIQPDTSGLLSKSGGTMTGTLVAKALQESRVALPANNIDLAAGNFFSKTIPGATTLTVSNTPAAGITASFILDLTNGGSATITWWSGVKWGIGVAPTLTAAGRDVIGFFTHDGGTTWTGLLLGKDVK